MPGEASLVSLWYDGNLRALTASRGKAAFDLRHGANCRSQGDRVSCGAASRKHSGNSSGYQHVCRRVPVFIFSSSLRAHASKCSGYGA